jgi:hypothetical protein
VSVIHVQSWEEARKARNMAWHVAYVEKIVAILSERPTITAINALRLALDELEHDIKAGDAA